MKIIALSFSLAVLAVSPALAAHNNPWATPEDTLLAQNHDENQLASVGTPGEDEMRGVMVQNANQTGGNAGQGDGGQGGGGQGNGGGGQGGGGQGNGGGGQGGGGQGNGGGGQGGGGNR